MADLTIQNARWLKPDGSFGEGALVVREGLVRLGAVPDPGAPTIDGAGMLVLPGAIDAHTHLREPGQEHKEGIERGTRAALAGGVTTVLDMPNNAPPIDDSELLEKKRKLFQEKSRVNWGLHVQAPFRGLRRPHNVASVKIYMARSSSLPAVSGFEALGTNLWAHPRVAVHAEDESKFRPAADFPQARSHHLQRPREAVVSALALIEEVLDSFPEEERPRLILCHASTIEEVAWLARMKRSGLDVWGETCPHYWRLTEDDYLREGPKLKVNPPLRTRADAEAIFNALASGTIDLVSTDHAPHTPEEKADEARAPSGIPSIEWYLPLMLELVESAHIGWRRLFDLTVRNAARCYQIQGGVGIVDGAPANLVLAVKQPGAPRPPIITAAAYDPYPQAAYAWRAQATVVNGHLAWQAGRESEQFHAGREVTFE